MKRLTTYVLASAMIIAGVHQFAPSPTPEHGAPDSQSADKHMQNREFGNAGMPVADNSSARYLVKEGCAGGPLAPGADSEGLSVQPAIYVD